MSEKIVKLSLATEKAERVLYQYDKGQIIEFTEEIPDETHVLLSNNKSLKAQRALTVANRVEIPDNLLKVEGTLTINIQVVDERSETTTKIVKIPIIYRKAGRDEVAEENQQTFVQQVQGILNETKEIAQSVRDDANNGKFDGKDYVLTEEDKEEIAGMVSGGGSGVSGDYVPITRKVANKELSDDITPDNIVASFYNNTNQPLSSFEQLLSKSFEMSLKASKKDLENYYDKEEVDNIVESIDTDVDLSNYYTKSETEDKIDEKLKDVDVDLSDYYTKDEVNQIGLEAINLSKVKYEGDNPPSDNPEDYSPDIKRGDIYYCQDEDRFYYVQDFYLDLLGFGGIVGVIWKPMITGGSTDGYSKEEIDQKFEELEEKINQDELYSMVVGGVE